MAYGFIWISFKVEFIAGVDNGIADSMSRLCRNNMVDSPTEYSPRQTLLQSLKCLQTNILLSVLYIILFVAILASSELYFVSTNWNINGYFNDSMFFIS